MHVLGHRLVLLATAAALLLAAGARIPDARAGESPRLIGRIPVKEPGFIRVSEATLQKLGAPSAAHVTVTRRGRLVARSRGYRTSVVFLANDHGSDHSAWGVYELWAHPEPARVPALEKPPALEEFPVEPPTARRVLATDRVHGHLAAALPEVYDRPDSPTWFLAFVPPKQGANLALDPMGAAPETAQTLEVRVYATHRGAVALRASWGEHDLGVARRGSAAGGTTLVWELPADAVPAEGAALALRDVSPPLPPPPPRDASMGRGALWIDHVALSGPVEPRFDGRLRGFAMPSRASLEFDGEVDEEVDHVDLWLVLVDADGKPLPLPHTKLRLSPEPRLRVTALGAPEGSTLYGSTRAREVEVRPASDPRPDPLARALSARHLILSVPELLEPATRLAAYRTRAGLPSAVVPVTEVYDRYGHGEPTPDAIRAFLVARMEEDAVPLEYVVLAGDAVLDRTDMTPFTTIPAFMARTMYNGATPADRLYALPPGGSDIGGPSIGRLPFRDAETLTAYVDRVVAYESSPPADASRRLLRFVTNEGRFGKLIDTLIEGEFKRVITKYVPPAYDIEVTFASAASPYLWPPADFNAKVIDGFAKGCLFYTYVGHGFGRGFDSLRLANRVFPVLHVDHVERIACRGTPPVVFVLACTTGIFDQSRWEGIGEALLGRPEGPVAYWGATRICHPAANVFFGRSIAQHMAQGEGRWRLGQMIDRARDEVLSTLRLPSAQKSLTQKMLEGAIRMLARGSDPARLALEGAWMYSLLGDPALQVAFPQSDLTVEAKITENRDIEVRVVADLAEGTEIRVSLEVPRNAALHAPKPPSDPLAPEAAAQIRDNHRLANDLALARDTLTTRGPETLWTVPLPEEIPSKEVIVKAWTISGGDVRQGAAVVEVPPVPTEESESE